MDDINKFLSRTTKKKSHIIFHNNQHHKVSQNDIKTVKKYRTTKCAYKLPLSVNNPKRIYNLSNQTEKEIKEKIKEKNLKKSAKIKKNKKNPNRSTNTISINTRKQNVLNLNTNKSTLKYNLNKWNIDSLTYKPLKVNIENEEQFKMPVFSENELKEFTKSLIDKFLPKKKVKYRNLLIDMKERRIFRLNKSINIGFIRFDILNSGKYIILVGSNSSNSSNSIISNSSNSNSIISNISNSNNNNSNITNNTITNNTNITIANTNGKLICKQNLEIISQNIKYETLQHFNYQSINSNPKIKKSFKNTAPLTNSIKLKLPTSILNTKNPKKETLDFNLKLKSNFLKFSYFNRILLVIYENKFEIYYLKVNKEIIKSKGSIVGSNRNNTEGDCLNLNLNQTVDEAIEEFKDKHVYEEIKSKLSCYFELSESFTVDISNYNISSNSNSNSNSNTNKINIDGFVENDRVYVLHGDRFDVYV